MLLSRGTALCRLINTAAAVRNVRNMSGHAYAYRTANVPHSKKTLFFAEAAGGLMWWWILWHLWTEPEHITGEFPYPDPSKWTNQELGIPDDE